jgi:putative membrane protein
VSVWGTPENGKLSSTLSGVSDYALTRLVYGLSTVVCLLVLVLILSPQLLRIEGLNVSGLPRFHAILNGSTAILLAVGYFLIRRKEILWHRRAMVGAFSLSCVFLISYVIYHSQAQTSAFGGEGWIRFVYFFILISHILLAPVVLPLALYSVIRALRGEFARHRRVARWTFPVWLYVALSGVTVYLMMSPYYNK